MNSEMQTLSEFRFISNIQKIYLCTHSYKSIYAYIFRYILYSEGLVSFESVTLSSYCHARIF